MTAGSLKVEGESGGEEEEDTRKVEIMVDSIDYLSNVRSQRISHIQFVLSDDMIPKDTRGEQDVSCISSLQALLGEPRFQGTTHAYLKYTSGDVSCQLKLPYRLNLSDELLCEVDKILGYGSYQMR